MNRIQEYYYRDLKKLAAFVCGGEKTLIINGKNYSQRKNLYAKSASRRRYVIWENVVGQMEDVQAELQLVKKYLKPDERMVIIYYNHLWEPILNLATLLGWRKKTSSLNWLETSDLENLLGLSGFEPISASKRLLIPADLGVVSKIINEWLAQLPIVNYFCLTTWITARLKPVKPTDLSVSIIVPARNEEGNIPRIIKSLPKFGRRQEILFVEGHSRDNTWGEIQRQVTKYSGQNKLRVTAFKQRGVGKADAVRLGFAKATGEMLIILDADLTVDPNDLVKFYDGLRTGQGEFMNGSRLVYPMENQAMQTLNILGNKIFSLLFTWILGQKFKDTLCGTKALLRRDYPKIMAMRKFFGDFDPFGDYELIFGAVKQNFKVVEIPVRYRQRRYGKTNISRFTHGWLLLKMTWFAFLKFKVW